MKQLISILLFLLPGSMLFAQQSKSYIKKGNELYQQQKYTEAEASYRKSVAKKSATIEGNFNLGDALYKQKKFADASHQFTHIAEAASGNKAVAAQAYHNLGNSFLENKKLEEGIAAYKKALINNPKDDQTRYNLAYAQEMLKKQQQQNKNKNQDKNQQNKDQQKDKDQNKDNKNQDKNKDQDKDKKDQGKQDQDKKDQQNGQKPQPDKLSKDDAERMLDAMNNQEKQTQDKLKNKKFKGEKVRISKDW